METKELVQLIETVTKTLNAQGFEHISLNHEGTSLTLNKQSVAGQTMTQAPMMMAAPTTTSPSAQTPSVSAASEPVQVTEVPKPVVETANLGTIESPIVGTFYNAPSPDAAPYVQVGSKVKKGDVVCIIEAMKLMNEIEAEEAGEIVEICVANEGPVEYGQILFKIKAL